jgi:mlo protein
MGSNMKKSIFDEQTSKALKKWHMAVKKKHGGRGGKSPTLTLGGSPASTVHSSSGHTLHRFKTTGHSTRVSTYEDPEISDYEADTLSPNSSTANLIIRVDDDEQPTEMIETHLEEETSNEDDFSFVKPEPLKKT